MKRRQAQLQSSELMGVVGLQGGSSVMHLKVTVAFS